MARSKTESKASTISVGGAVYANVTELRQAVKTLLLAKGNSTKKADAIARLEWLHALKTEYLQFAHACILSLRNATPE